MTAPCCKGCGVQVEAQSRWYWTWGTDPGGMPLVLGERIGLARLPLTLPWQAGLGLMLWQLCLLLFIAWPLCVGHPCMINAGSGGLFWRS